MIGLKPIKIPSAKERVASELRQGNFVKTAKRGRKSYIGKCSAAA